MAEPAKKGDWLLLDAELNDGQVTPSFELRNQKDVSKEVTQGAPVASAPWSVADLATLKAVAAQAAPGIVALLEELEAARQKIDPNSLRNRLARVYEAAVTGAPVDGDALLAHEAVALLPGLGEHATDKPDEADFSVVGQVATGPGLAGMLRFEL